MMKVAKNLELREVKQSLVKIHFIDEARFKPEET